jgi:hypothetical protein
MITNLHRNRMGTVSFDGQFTGMRKPQDFIVYPLHAGDQVDRIVVQSNKRIGYICLASGKVDLTPSRQGGAYFHHLPAVARVSTLEAEELLLLKAHILDSASGRAGTNGLVYTDNSAAIDIFGATA